MVTVRPLFRHLASVRSSRRSPSLVVLSRWTEQSQSSNNKPHFADASPIRYLSTTSQSNKDETTKTKTQEPKLDEQPLETETEQPKKEMHKESLHFQAETRQLLDIVTHSLYTDKEVFLRELVSNASDALEKLRHLQVANIEGHEVCLHDKNKDKQETDVPLEIRIETDELNQTLTITDTGIGLTREDMISNLGTIAKSGSKAFFNEISRATSNEPDLDPARGLIGKFGVGFYSAFMVGDKVEVRSK
jgi:TNF receptor-associated protein 1